MSPVVPRVAGRVRASIALNGWVLEPIDGGTKLTYYLHVDVKTFVPAFAAMKYLVSLSRGGWWTFDGRSSPLRPRRSRDTR